MHLGQPGALINYRLEPIDMEHDGQGSVRVIVFGPLIDVLGSRSHKVPIGSNTSIEDVLVYLEIGDWIAKGITVALNNERCPMDIHPSNGDEIAVLPPVSGG
ncbi:MAG: MoaD/ThiS family protein [Candidatus Poseidoniales archaeon]|nr:MAG: MoaD/ThiS family protein [Candidatus Poseidoniales archaeon]